jgi:hypothetical protein
MTNVYFRFHLVELTFLIIVQYLAAHVRLRPLLFLAPTYLIWNVNIWSLDLSSSKRGNLLHLMYEVLMITNQGTIHD